MQIFYETPVSFRFPRFSRQSVAEPLFRWTENEDGRSKQDSNIPRFDESVID